MRQPRLLPAVLLSLVVVGPVALRAQASDAVCAGKDVDTPPRIGNPARTARLVAESYPALHKRSGVAGQAQVQFVVDTSGRVEPETVEVVIASTPDFALAAKRVAAKLEFTPGKAKGLAVRTRVILPIRTSGVVTRNPPRTARALNDHFGR